MLTTMNWTVTAWLPLGGLGSLHVNSFTIKLVASRIARLRWTPTVLAAYHLMLLCRVFLWDKNLVNDKHVVDELHPRKALSWSEGNVPLIVYRWTHLLRQVIASTNSLRTCLGNFLFPFQLAFFSEISWRHTRRCFSPYQQPKCSRRWARLSPLSRRWFLNLLGHTHTETHTLPQLTPLLDFTLYT